MILPVALALPVRLRFVAAALLVGGIATILPQMLAPLPMCVCGERKADIAEAMLKKLAFEAYPQWSMRPANAGACPTVEQLGEFMASAHPRDPWGQDFIIRCTDLPPGAMGIAVMSKGEDKRAGTADDLTSWDL